MGVRRGRRRVPSEDGLAQHRAAEVDLIIGKEVDDVHRADYPRLSAARRGRRRGGRRRRRDRGCRRGWSRRQAWRRRRGRWSRRRQWRRQRGRWSRRRPWSGRAGRRNRWREDDVADRGRAEHEAAHAGDVEGECAADEQCDPVPDPCDLGKADAEGRPPDPDADGERGCAQRACPISPSGESGTEREEAALRGHTAEQHAELREDAIHQIVGIARGFQGEGEVDHCLRGRRGSRGRGGVRRRSRRRGGRRRRRQVFRGWARWEEVGEAAEAAACVAEAAIVGGGLAALIVIARLGRTGARRLAWLEETLGRRRCGRRRRGHWRGRGRRWRWWLIGRWRGGRAWNRARREGREATEAAT